MFTREEIESAQRIIYSVLRPTPQFEWPLLSAELGLKVWVKHENHQPVGAFKIRGGITYSDALIKRESKVRGVISATRGNHGQSIGFAARMHGIAATIVVPHGNSIEKNAAMRALGVERVEAGNDFQESREHAMRMSIERHLHMVPSYHRDLVRGITTCWIEFFEAVEPEVIFVPIGLGSSLSAAAAARAYTGVGTKIIGVVSAQATAYLDSYRAGRVIETSATTQLADGMACRVPDEESLAVVRREVEDLIAVTDEEVAAAMRLLFKATHNVAEGAGAASLAAAMQQRQRWHGKTVGTILCGGNVDTDVYAKVLGGG